ncbi:protein YpfM [Salmonella enterica]|nr:protein YpfM [Salmonella enterica]
MNWGTGELGNWGTGELGNWKDFIEVMLRNKCLEGTALP